MSRLRTVVCSAALTACFLAAGATTASAAAPAVTETAATNLQGTSALLTGRIDTGSQATSYHFEYVDRTTFEADQPNGFVHAVSTPTHQLSAAVETRGVSAAISGLSTQTTYEFRL